LPEGFACVLVGQVLAIYPKSFDGGYQACILDTDAVTACIQNEKNLPLNLLNATGYLKRMEDVQKQIDDVLASAFRREFWLDLQDQMHTSYEAAQDVSTGSSLKLERPDIVRARPQIRHYTLNAAFRRAARSSGYEYVDAETVPKGENYVIVSADRVRVSRIGLNHNDINIRSAKHRSLIAELNHDYEGYTPDFFGLNDNELPGDRSGSLGVLLLNINPPLSAEQDRMLDLRVTVPFTNLKGFHYNRSIIEILELYSVEREIVVPDIAIPRLKKRLKDQEI